VSDFEESFVRRVGEVWGDHGRAWLAQLPQTLTGYAERWSLTLLAPFPGLTYNYAVPVRRADGSPAVLKVGVPDEEFRTQAEALRHFDGCGSVRLLEADLDGHALLLEHAEPGTPLSSVSDDAAAVSIAVGVMRNLWRPAPADHGFPTTARWSLVFGRMRARFDGGTGPLPDHLVERAERLSAALEASAGEPVLQHGDLHHDNILRAARAPWLAIDPKGLVGEREHETGALLLNPRPWIWEQPDLARILARRMAQLSDELELSAERVREWAFVWALRSACWTLEDNGSDWQGVVRCAEVLADLAV
jgi:streptomycin 6-kinase